MENNKLVGSEFYCSASNCIHSLPASIAICRCNSVELWVKYLCSGGRLWFVETSERVESKRGIPFGPCPRDVLSKTNRQGQHIFEIESSLHRYYFIFCTILIRVFKNWSNLTRKRDDNLFSRFKTS